MATIQIGSFVNPGSELLKAKFTIAKADPDTNRLFIKSA